jgi:outer membrane protein insertion porin family
LSLSFSATWRVVALCLAALLCRAQQAPEAPRPGAPDPRGTPAAGAEPGISPPAASSSSIASAAYQGLRVRDIQFRGFPADPAVLQHLRRLVVQGTNEPFDRDKIRRSIQALYATGRFADIQVEAERAADNQLSLVFVARGNFFIGSVTVEGNPKRPAANQLINTTKLQLGELYTPEKVSHAIANLKSVLADNGYYRADIVADEQFHAETQQVDIRFHIAPDGLARVGEVTIRGKPGLSAGQVADVAHLHSGDAVSMSRTTRALQRLRKHYQQKGRLEAQVGISRDFDPRNNTLNYVFNIEEGPIVEFDVEGAKLSQNKLKKLVPVFEEGAIDDDLLNEGLRNIRDYFQTQGFFDVRVRWERSFVAAENRTRVLYVVDPGMRHKLQALQIQGNHFFSTGLIRERMQVRPSGGFLAQGLFSESLLARDIAAIENLYRSNGFQQVHITHEVNDDYQGQRGHMMVAIKIDEGPQTRVASLAIVGNNSIPTSELLAQVSNIAGQAYSDSNTASDREAILSYYLNRGFPNVSFEASALPVAGDPNLVHVTYTIVEGGQVFVDRVLISGLHYTRPYVVNRQLQLRPGDPLSQFAMQETQRHLYDLGIFNEVDVAVQNPDGQARYKNVLLQMQEARRWTFTYGFGFEVQSGASPGSSSIINTAPAPGINVPPNTNPPSNTVLASGNPQGGTGFSPRITFDVTRLNFRGIDHTLLFKSHLGNLQKRALVSYEAPRWFDRDNMRLTFSGMYDNSRDVRTFTSERMEGSVQAEQVMSPVTTLLYRFNYRRVRVDAKTLAINPELVPLLSKPVRVGMPSFSYIRDKRDNPLDATRGNYTTFDTGVASRVFGSAASFGRFVLQNSTYAPTRHKIVFARSTRIGVEEPFGSLPAASAIPLPERFFAGGANSHRGFALNQAGPRDLLTGFPLGGNATFINSFELRLPPPQLPLVGTNLSFVLFHDSGNVFETGQDMVNSLLRWHQPNRNACFSEATHLQCRFDYMSQAVGTGFRYRTPLGPARVDVSYSLNPPAFPYFVQCPATRPANERPPCSLLPPNQLIFQSGTLRHFNFFFSIGQSF